MSLCVTYKCILLFILFGFVKCADKPEQHPVSSESDGEEEDNFEVTETSEQPKSFSPKGTEHLELSKKSDKIIFMKENENGIMAPMQEGDYKQIFEDPYKKVYIFQASLEMILFDYKVIFEHVYRKPYATSLTYFKINVFTIQHENGFMLIRHEEGKWKVYLRNRSGYLNLYTQHKGKDVELCENNYYISFGPRGFLKYEFKSDVNCSKVMFKDKLVWRRNSNEPCPSKVSITLKKDIILYFDAYYLIFLKSHFYNLF